MPDSPSSPLLPYFAISKTNLFHFSQTLLTGRLKNIGRKCNKTFMPTPKAV